MVSVKRKVENGAGILFAFKPYPASVQIYYTLNDE